MTPDMLGEVIATREFSFPDENDRDASASILIGKPLPSLDSSGYQCHFLIKGLGDERIQIARGYDSLQALQSALILAGASLNHLNEKAGRRLRWAGGTRGDLGFP
ncbi:MAG TPA: hypothetical protein VNG71_08085 [Pyrinomonadaceae bacterium]|nr:hypothetical protein [Pyrinomonadaceae bacterium]